MIEPKCTRKTYRTQSLRRYPSALRRPYVALCQPNLAFTLVSVHIAATVNQRLLAYLQITRPANIVTAVADILAGFAASGALVMLYALPTAQWWTHPLTASLGWLVLSTVGLYGGGIVFNDVFDAELDRTERPERPIPRGDASGRGASILATLLLTVGVLAAAQVSLLSALIALIVAGLAVLYNAWGKHQRLFGPVNMGLCRGGNLLLGVSAVPAAVTSVWFLSLITIVYIAAITMISRGEVHGSNRAALWGGVSMYSLVISGLLALAVALSVSVELVIPFLLLLGFLIYPPLLRALRSNEPRLIGLAVKAGVLSLIVLDAAIAATFGGWVFGLLVLLLLPLSRWLATRFAVT